MDKGLERIKTLTIQLEEELKKFNTILINKEQKNNQNNKLKEEERILTNINKGIINDKNEIIYYMENIEKWKKKKNIFTILSILICEIASIVLSNLIIFLRKDALAVILLINIFIIPLSIYYCDINDYRGAKKYLKKNKLEDVEKELEENQKELNLNKQKQNTIENEIINLEMNQKILEVNIQNLRAEIEKINNIIKDIINNYITDNKELDQLLDSGYHIYEEENKEKTKQLIKE